jgi:exodeoxyribonuclease V alpha subunit
LVNGLMGTVRRIVSHDPCREDSPYLVINFEGILVTLTRSEVERYLQKSYALTVHKAQGSDWKTVIAVLTAHSLLVDRSMIYTALSRCKERCVIITSELPAIAEAVSQDPFFKRRNDRFMMGLNERDYCVAPVQMELF